MLIIGHRGAGGHAPDNTLAGIRAALHLDVNMIEVDVQMTADGQLILAHDRYLKTPAGERMVAGITTAELLELRDRSGGAEFPDLVEVAHLLQNTPVKLLVELKQPDIARFVITQLDDLLSDHYQIASFHHAQLVRVKNINPAIPTIALFEANLTDAPRYLRSISADMAGSGFGTFHFGLQTELRMAGIPHYVWTVNKESEIREAVRAGVDGVISDFPERVRRIMQEERAGRRNDKSDQRV